MTKKFIIMLLLFLSLNACVYSFRNKYVNLPLDIKTIFIPMTKNYTNEFYIETIFTNEIITNFNKSKILKLSTESQADIILKSYIRKIELQDIALNKNFTSKQRQLWVTISVRLIYRNNNKVIWEDQFLEKSRNYIVSNSIQSTEIAKRQAYKLLAKDIAQIIHDRILEDF